MVPVILNLPVKDLAPGMYKLEIMGWIIPENR